MTAEDIRAVAYPVLRHRIFTNFNADAEGVDVDQVIEKILETVPEPSYGETAPSKGRTGRSAPPAPDARPATSASSALGEPGVSAPPTSGSTARRSSQPRAPRSPAALTRLPWSLHSKAQVALVPWHSRSLSQQGKG